MHGRQVKSWCKQIIFLSLDWIKLLRMKVWLSKILSKKLFCFLFFFFCLLSLFLSCISFERLVNSLHLWCKYNLWHFTYYIALLVHIFCCAVWLTICCLFRMLQFLPFILSCWRKWGHLWVNEFTTWIHYMLMQMIISCVVSCNLKS